MADKFNAGDVVMLKSGGPKMTIIRIGDFARQGHAALCFWFDGNRKEQAFFTIESLERYQE